jgi:hypothetical protein
MRRVEVEGDFELQFELDLK